MEEAKQEYFTLSQIKKSKEIVKVDKGLDQYKNDADHLAVANQTDYNAAADFCKNIKVAAKKIVEKRLFFVTPYNETVKKINSIFKEKVLALGEIEKVLKRKMLNWYDAETIKKAAEQHKIDEANRKKLAKVQVKQDENPEKIIAPPVLKSNPEKLAQTSKGEFSTSTVKQNWKWDVTSPGIVPREYMIIDSKKINAMVRAGVRKIDGLNIYPENNVNIG